MASRALRRRSTYRALNGHRKDKPHPFMRIILVILVAFTMLTSGASAATIFFYGQDLPSLNKFAAKVQFQDTVIRDRNGRVLYDLADVSRKDRGRRTVEPLVDPSHPQAYYTANHEYWVKGTDADKNARGVPHPQAIPIILQNATIATEDATFYSNFGFDPMSILRAGYDNLTTGHVVSGASTITQQLIKRFMLSPSPSLSRKAEEIILAAELTQKYPKSEILWYYLNSVSYGNLAIGAEAAAQAYFHTDVWNLDLAQSALLAGLPEAPSIYDPITNFPAAKARMRYVLHLMDIHGYLKNASGRSDPSIIGRAMAEAKTWKFAPVSNPQTYPHFVQYVINWLQQQPELNKYLYNGLDVTTTVDPQLQEAAQRYVHDQIAGLGSYNVTDGAAVTMDIRHSCYGCILAMVGSPDYYNKAISGQYNMADTPRQPGSSFKPFNYALAFKNGLSPATTVLDGPIAIPDTGNPQDGGWYTPTDYDKTWHGVVTLRTALQNSLNVPAVRVEQFNAQRDGGGQNSIKDSVGALAVKMGIDDLFVDNPTCCGWSLTLGGLDHGVRLVQETSAYGAFGTGGYKVPPIPVWQVRLRTTGKVLWDARRHFNYGDSVLNPAIAFLMNNVLSDNAARCAAVCEFGTDSPLNLGRPAAAKTGTTNLYTDNWTVGYTPQIVTGVWVGNADNSQMVGTTGVTGAAPIWNLIMLKAIDLFHLPPVNFYQPPGVSFGSTCSTQGPYGVSYLTTTYDAYYSQVPLCSVGADSASTLPVQPSTQSSGAALQPPPVAQPTAVPQASPSSPQQVQPAQTSLPTQQRNTQPTVPQQTVPQQSVPQQPTTQQPSQNTQPSTGGVQPAPP